MSQPQSLRLIFSERVWPFQVVGTQVVDGAAAAGHAHPSTGEIALLVDAGGAVGVVPDRAAAVADRGGQIIHTAVHGTPYPRLTHEVDLRMDTYPSHQDSQ
ncbi:hypothetical protein Shyhy02_43200 [Streptomyces hygroscopicus subsp. hygroscopicus]|nr:hypothetical protein Shyhy02_43200 [Streptomyces hygroscopicus subsp. hygroscopicus]